MTNKRKHGDSPLKGKMADIIDAISSDTTEFEKCLDSEAKVWADAGSYKKLSELMAKTFKGPVMGFIKKQADHLSDLCQKVNDLEVKLDQALTNEMKTKEKLEDIEKQRETLAVKDSRKEMAARMEVATTQVKVLDVNFDKHIDERKELVQAANERLRAKVKAADQEKYNQLIKKAVVQVLAKQTVKRKRRSDG
jgi:hypothetical protein